MALVLREAELNRREATLRRAEEARAEDEGSDARVLGSSTNSRTGGGLSSARA